MKLTSNTSQETPEKAPDTRQAMGNWQLWIGVAFSLGFLFLALRDVDLTETANALSRVNLPIFGAAAASYMLTVAAKAIRWRLLFTGRKTPSFDRALSALSIGIMVNAFLPARLGEVTRAYLMGEAESESKVYALGTVAVEKVTDLLFLLFALILLLSQMTLPEWLAGPARGTALTLAVLVPCLLLLAWQRDFVLRIVERASRFVPSTWQEWLVRQAHYGLDSLNVMRHPRLLIGLFGWSLIIWILSAFTNYLVFLALELAVPIWTSLLLLVVLHIGTSVPSSPGRIGVFQYLVILTLSIVAVDKNVALGYSVVLYLAIYAPMVLTGCYYLWREKITWQKLEEAAAMLNRLGRRTR